MHYWIMHSHKYSRICLYFLSQTSNIIHHEEAGEFISQTKTTIPNLSPKVFRDVSDSKSFSHWLSSSPALKHLQAVSRTAALCSSLSCSHSREQTHTTLRPIMHKCHWSHHGLQSGMQIVYFSMAEKTHKNSGNWYNLVEQPIDT